MVSPDVYEALYFILMGLFGAALYVITQVECWEDFRKFEYIRHFLLGPFVGFFYYRLYSDLNFPNTVMSIVAGYSGTNFVTWIIDFLRERLRRDE